MKYLALVGAILLAGAAQAQGFVDEPTCYSWSGGYKSSGSFSKCTPELMAAAKPTPPPVAVSAPVAPTPVVAPAPMMSPLMMPICANPVPLDKPKPKKHKPKPKPKHIC